MKTRQQDNSENTYDFDTIREINKIKFKQCRNQNNHIKPVQRKMVYR